MWKKIAEGSTGAAEAAKKWLDTFSSGVENGAATDELCQSAQGAKSADAKEIARRKTSLAKKSQWIFGGDGWAYDIGYGG